MEMATCSSGTNCILAPESIVRDNAVLGVEKSSPAVLWSWQLTLTITFGTTPTIETRARVNEEFVTVTDDIETVEIAGVNFAIAPPENVDGLVVH